MSAYDFIELDQVTRHFMMEELAHDDHRPMMSRQFTERGRNEYPRLLREAIAGGDAASLIAALSQQGRMQATPVNAAERFGGTEFNRYYARAICRRALAHGSTEVRVYRARESAAPRPASQELVGSTWPATTVLDDLRTNTTDGFLGVAKVSSGLSLRCGCDGCQQRSP